VAVETLERASQICIDMGRHGQAAKHCQSIAEHYETTDPEKSMQYYQQVCGCDVCV
jgi:predicted ATPase